MLKELADCGREIILCGDWNIAHKEIDLKNWRSNQKNSGFLPEERASGLPEFLTSLNLSMYFGESTLRLSNIPGGPIGGKHGQKTLVGALTIRLPHPRLLAKRLKFRFTRRNVFPIIRR